MIVKTRGLLRPAFFYHCTRPSIRRLVIRTQRIHRRHVRFCPIIVKRREFRSLGNKYFLNGICAIFFVIACKLQQETRLIPKGNIPRVPTVASIYLPQRILVAVLRRNKHFVPKVINVQFIRSIISVHFGNVFTVGKIEGYVRGTITVPFKRGYACVFVFERDFSIYRIYSNVAVCRIRFPFCVVAFFFRNFWCGKPFRYKIRDFFHHFAVRNKGCRILSFPYAV